MNLKRAVKGHCYTVFFSIERQCHGEREKSIKVNQNQEFIKTWEEIYLYVLIEIE